MAIPEATQVWNLPTLSPRPLQRRTQRNDEGLGSVDDSRRRWTGVGLFFDYRRVAHLYGWPITVGATVNSTTTIKKRSDDSTERIVSKALEINKLPIPEEPVGRVLTSLAGPGPRCMLDCRHNRDRPGHPVGSAQNVETTSAVIPLVRIPHCAIRIAHSAASRSAHHQMPSTVTRSAVAPA